jgi:hypothetical protein
MKKNKIISVMEKNKIIIISTLLIILGMSIALLSTQDSKKKSVKIISSEKMESEMDNKVCYLSKTKAKTKSKNLLNSENVKYLEFTELKSENQVDGVISYLMAGKDVVKGNFLGVLKDDYLNVIFSGESKNKK